MSAEPQTNRVLFVSYLFPPVGGVGVLRVAKFVKFLPEFGWNSSVLTAANPSVPLFDHSLLGEIPDTTVIRKAQTREPAYALKSSAASAASPSAGGQGKSRLAAHFTCAAKRKATARLQRTLKRIAGALLQPDAQILWYPAAVREGVRLLSEQPHDAIVATGPPFTNLLVGAALSRKTGVPLLLDYRDDWGISNAYWENKRPGRLAEWVQRRMQDHALRAASDLVATTPSSSQMLQQFAHHAGSTANSTHIYNGFDPSDFPAADKPPAREDFGNGTGMFRLSFAGTLWELTSLAPFVVGVERLAQRAPRLLECLEIVLAGRRAGRQEEFVDRLSGLPCQTVRLGYLDHPAAIRLMMTSDSLLLLLSEVPHAERVISSKVFEYMAARRPVFAVTGPGDQCDVLREHPAATICAPKDPDGIAASLAARLEEHRCGMRHSGADWDFSQFERRAQAGQMAALLDDLSDLRSTGSNAVPHSPSVLTASLGVAHRYAFWSQRRG